MMVRGVYGCTGGYLDDIQEERCSVAIVKFGSPMYILFVLREH